MDKIAQLLSANPALCLVGVLILVFIALGVGYIIGNNTLNKKASKEVDEVINQLRYDGAVRSSIIDNVNLGVLAYSEEGLLYKNNTIRDLVDFYHKEEGIPETIDAFLDRYDNGNHLKSNYILSCENEMGSVRANYVSGMHIYEVKVIHRPTDNGRLSIVIVDDITQIKDDERRQKDLAANVSHELKTPLTVIRASEFFVNNITPEKMPTYEEIVKWGNRIVANAVRMQDIVQDFLILSMCSSSVQMTIIDVGETINKAVNNLTDYPGRNNVNIKVPADMYFPLVFGNSNLLMRVIINLLTNAIKYIDYDGKTEPHEIKVEVSQIGDRIGIEVSDNGRGIPSKDINHLFERFFRVDNSGSRDVGGSGIGLAIAKDIANMHDATINVVSELGRGSAFTLMIPQALGVFRSIYEDATSGVVSENPYYRNATEFMAIQSVEAAKSMGYDDVMDEVEAYESVDVGEKVLRDHRLTELLKKMGEKRYMELVEELTYIDPEDEFDDEFEDEFDEESDEGLDEEFGEEAEEVEDIPEEPTAEEIAEEEEIKKQKEEARKILTQQILPRAVPNSAPATLQNDDNSKERVTIHPIFENKMYNNVESEGASEKTEGQSPEIQSAVRKVLDEAVPLQVAPKNDIEENN